MTRKAKKQSKIPVAKKSLRELREDQLSGADGGTEVAGIKVRSTADGCNTYRCLTIPTQNHNQAIR